MKIKVGDAVVNHKTGEIGVVIATHTYTPEGVEVASVKFTHETLWVVKSCLRLLKDENEVLS